MKFIQQFDKKSNRIHVLISCLVLIFLFIMSACKFATEDALPNTEPNTTLANIPIEGDTLYALVTLAWDGEDNDGFIANYRYRYTTYYLEEGQTIDEVNPDSIVAHGWVDTTETSVTVAFDSPSPINYQIFEVVAVDNDGNVDPTPAVKKFYTNPTSFPTSQILIPSVDKQDMFAKNQTDDWWPGVPLKYSASDADGHVIEYAWKVNDGEWHWTEDSMVYIDPSEFIPLEETHWLYVICRDNTNLVDPIGAARRVRLHYPSFLDATIGESDIVIIDETREDYSFDSTVTDAKIDSFYWDIYGGNRGDLDITEWDYQRRGMMSMRRLKDYKMIIWHSDMWEATKSLYTNRNLIENYLNMGGKLVLSGHRTLGGFMDASYERPPPASGWNPPLSFKPSGWNSFVSTYLHVNIADVSSPEGNLTGITGMSENFTGELTPVLSKIPDRWPYIPIGDPDFRGMGNIFTFHEWGGFTVPIYRYHSIHAYIDGMPCGLRYFGSVYDLIYLGFPIWFMDDAGAKQLGNDVLKSMGF